MPVTIITGYPRTGKTTLTNRMQGVRRLHTDSIKIKWPDAFEVIYRWIRNSMRNPNVHTVIDGSIALYGLRRYLRKTRRMDLSDLKVVFKRKRYVPPNEGQMRFGKGLKKVWEEQVAPELDKKGATHIG